MNLPQKEATKHRPGFEKTLWIWAAWMFFKDLHEQLTSVTRSYCYIIGETEDIWHILIAAAYVFLTAEIVNRYGANDAQPYLPAGAPSLTDGEPSWIKRRSVFRTAAILRNARRGNRPMTVGLIFLVYFLFSFLLVVIAGSAFADFFDVGYPNSDFVSLIANRCATP